MERRQGNAEAGKSVWLRLQVLSLWGTGVECQECSRRGQLGLHQVLRGTSIEAALSKKKRKSIAGRHATARGKTRSRRDVSLEQARGQFGTACGKQQRKFVGHKSRKKVGESIPRAIKTADLVLQTRSARRLASC